MLDGVGDQFVEDGRQRLGLVGGDGPEVAGRDDLDAVVSGGDRPRHAHDRACNLVEVDGLVDVLGQGGVDGRDGLDAALGLGESHLDGILAGATRLQAQERGDGLQVVLDAVVDFADRRVLRHEFLLVAMHLGHVAQQDDCAQSLAPVDQGQGAQGNGGGARGDFDAPGGPAHDDDGHRFIDEGPIPDHVGDFLGEHLALDVVSDAEASQAGHGVGGGLLDAPVRVEQERAVEDARNAVGGHLGGGVVGVFAVRDHLAQRVGGGGGPSFEAEGQARAGQVFFAGDDGDDASVVAHGHAGFHHRVGACPAGGGGAHDLAGLDGAMQVDFAGGGQSQADDVVEVDGRGGRGAAVGGGDEAAVVRRQPQDEVGGCEVGEHLPIGSKQVQPIEVFLRQRCRRGFFS